MRIASVRIQNFRGFRDETIVLGNYSCFVGPNGAGKSTTLAALNVFFRQYRDSLTDLSRLTADDFHHRDVREPIRITVEFSDLSSQAKLDLANYVRKDRLIVSAVATYDPNMRVAEVQQFGNRLGLEKFRRYFEDEKNGAKAPELQERYRELQSEYSLANAKTKPEMAAQLHKFESELPESDLALIPSADQFYGVTKGANKLAPHIQWIFVPASKNMSVEADESKSSALGLLLERTIRARVNFADRIVALKEAAGVGYRAMLEEQQSVLSDLSRSIEERLRIWSHSKATAKVLWRQDPEKSVRIETPLAYMQVGERGFEGELTRFGHGLQRSCMLTLLQELVSGESSETMPTLIMGIEEPELYQHPPQTRYLSELLQQLAAQGAQVAICTHSPIFIPGEDIESVRVVRESGIPSATRIVTTNYEHLAKRMTECGEKLVKQQGAVAKLFAALNPTLNEMFFCQKLVLVESGEDVAYVLAAMSVSGRLDEFRRSGCHIVPVGRKSDLLRPVLVAQALSIPVFTIFDADTYTTKEEHITAHKKDNSALLKALGHASESEWPGSTIWKNNCAVWSTEIGRVIREEVGDKWERAYVETCKSYMNPGGLEKNGLAIAQTLEASCVDGTLPPSLAKLVDAILDFSKEVDHSGTTSAAA